MTKPCAFALSCLLWLVLWLLVTSLRASGPESFVVTLREQEVIDYRGIRHFDVLTTNEGRLLISGDADLPLVKRLIELNGQRVRVSIVVDAPERLER
jgi:hypothetical protein